MIKDVVDLRLSVDVSIIFNVVFAFNNHELVFVVRCLSHLTFTCEKKNKEKKYFLFNLIQFSLTSVYIYWVMYGIAKHLRIEKLTRKSNRAKFLEHTVQDRFVVSTCAFATLRALLRVRVSQTLLIAIKICQIRTRLSPETNFIFQTYGGGGWGIVNYLSL